MNLSTLKERNEFFLKICDLYESQELPIWMKELLPQMRKNVEMQRELINKVAKYEPNNSTM